MASLRELERRNILNALDEAISGNAGAHGAAKMLGMSPSTLAYHMKRLWLAARRSAKPADSNWTPMLATLAARSAIRVPINLAWYLAHNGSSP